VNERKKQLCTIVPKAPSRFSEFSLMTRRYALHVGQSSLLPVRNISFVGYATVFCTSIAENEVSLSEKLSQRMSQKTFGCISLKLRSRHLFHERTEKECEPKC